jgi:hypothetical protein
MKVNHGWIFLMIIATLTIAMAGVGQSSTATMTLDPSEVKDIDPGGTFNVDVTVADVSNLFGWQFLIRFDSRVLRVDNVTEGQFLGSTGEETLFVGYSLMARGGSNWQWSFGHNYLRRYGSGHNNPKI